MLPFVSFEHTNNLIREEIFAAFQQFFDNKSYILGPEVEKFERAYAEFNQVEHCIGISNGLDALHVALRALNINNGDEVIVPSNTYIATALAVSYTGAVPVFVEPEITTYNITAAAIERAITPLTKAIMPVNLYGQACELEDILLLAEKHNLHVIEDNAQAQGAAYKGQPTGSWGHINATSFYPGKNLGAFGDAGAITTNNIELAGKAAMLRNYGSQQKYHHDVIGFNMRLDECQAAFLSIKLKYLSGWTSQRQQIASWYDEALNGLGDLFLPQTAADATHVYHLYVVRTKQRDALQKYLMSNNIHTLIHYPIPPHLQPAYTDLGLKRGSFPVAEEIADTCLSLPMWPGMREQDVQQVADNISRFINK